MGNVSKITRKWFWMDGKVIWIWWPLRKNYDENNDKGYVLEVDVEYPKNVFNLYYNLPFLPKRKKLKNERSLFVACCTHNSFKTSIKSWINTKKIHKVIQFNQKAWLKPCIDMNTKLRTDAKMTLGKISLN